MIKSIKFTEGYGYISERYPKEKPKQPYPRHPMLSDLTEEERTSDNSYNRWHRESAESNEKRYKEEMERYEKDIEFWKKTKGKRKNPNLEHLIGRTFTFSKDKINVIFGKNASGKTTILKALAGNAFIEDGWSYPPSCVDVVGFEFNKQRDIAESFQQLLDKKRLNACEIEWDGVPIYFDNFTNRKTYGSIGDLCGSILTDVMDEVSYILGSNIRSKGQNSLYILDRIVGIAEQPITCDDLLNNYLEKNLYSENSAREEEWVKRHNDVINYVADHFRNRPNANSGEPNTFIFDEMDKSLDITTCIELYTKFLPILQEKYGIQIIIVSHSPIIMSDAVFNSEKYNIISMDEDYTKQCREYFANLIDKK